MDKNKKTILWITRTAVFIALLVVIQLATAPLGNTLVTGSLVNLVLILAVMTGGLACGATAAVISPVLAKLIGIGPLWSLIPFIMAGNLVLILVWHFIGNRKFGGRPVPYITALVCGAVLKFLVLFIGIVKIMVPVVLQLPEKQAAAVSAAFSFPQLITASVGGVIAILILPILKKAMNHS